MWPGSQLAAASTTRPAAWPEATSADRGPPILQARAGARGKLVTPLASSWAAVRHVGVGGGGVFLGPGGGGGGRGRAGGGRHLSDDAGVRCVHAAAGDRAARADRERCGGWIELCVSALRWRSSVEPLAAACELVVSAWMIEGGVGVRGDEPCFDLGDRQ